MMTGGTQKERVVGGKRCPVPGFLIIGAQKCGTSALTRYLSAHPQVLSATRKEIHFFDQDAAFHRGHDWYHRHFALSGHRDRWGIAFEATPCYLYYPKCPRRIFSYSPAMKLIVLLRDPVERAYSSWNMYRKFFYTAPERFIAKTGGADPEIRRWVARMMSRESFDDFDKEVEDDIERYVAGEESLEPSYVRRGLYYEQLARYFKLFQREQILIIESVSLRKDPHRVLGQVTRFLQLAEDACENVDSVDGNAGQYVRRMSRRTEAVLREFYRDHNERLYQAIGSDWGW
jgi:hypothetical protein